MNKAEATLFAHLTTKESLDYLVREGFSAAQNRECIPGELAPQIVGWVIDVYFKSGRTVAPTREGILETWGDEMEKIELAIDDEYETDSVEWAVDQLRATFAVDQANDFAMTFATDLMHAAPPDKVSVVKENAGKLYGLIQKLTSHYAEMPVDIGLDDAWVRYQERAVARQHIQGLAFGLPEIDNHTMGVHDGEVAVFAAFSGVGKTWMAIKAAIAEWRRGRRAVIITLECSVEEIVDRMACMAGGLDYERWQRGDLDEGSLIRFHAFRERVQATDHAPIVIMPEEGDRDPVALARRALAMHGESLIVDQLSHVERVPGSRARARNEIVAEQVKAFKVIISEGREKIPLLLFAQINREGRDAAQRKGRYEMTHLAESSEIERSADFVFSALSQPTEGNEHGLLLQKLKGRRVQPQPEAWEMIWRLGVGDIRVARELSHV